MQPLTLHAVHQASGASFGEVGGQEVVLHHGDPGAEYQTLTRSTVLHDRSYRQMLRLVGEDRISFLQGMVTNDIKALADNTWTYTAILTAKGAMVADARVLRTSDALFLDCEPGVGTTLCTFLNKFLISEEAELTEVTGGFALLGVYGPSWKDAVPLSMELGPQTLARETVGGVPVLAAKAFGVGAEGVELWVQRDFLSKVYRALASQVEGPIGFEAVECSRVEAGIPRYGQDMELDTLPMEAGLGHAISFTKGCYIGQEVVARATYRGALQWSLAGFLLGDQPLPPKTDLFRAGKKLGQLTSVVRSPAAGEYVALGYIHRDAASPGEKIATTEGLSATVSSLPFRR